MILWHVRCPWNFKGYYTAEGAAKAARRVVKPRRQAHIIPVYSLIRNVQQSTGMKKLGPLLLTIRNRVVKSSNLYNEFRKMTEDNLFCRPRSDGRTRITKGV